MTMGFDMSRKLLTAKPALLRLDLIEKDMASWTSDPDWFEDDLVFNHSDKQAIYDLTVCGKTAEEDEIFRCKTISGNDSYAVTASVIEDIAEHLGPVSSWESTTKCFSSTSVEIPLLIGNTSYSNNDDGNQPNTLTIYWGTAETYERLHASDVEIARMFGIEVVDYADPNAFKSLRIVYYSPDPMNWHVLRCADFFEYLIRLEEANKIGFQAIPVVHSKRYGRPPYRVVTYIFDPESGTP